MKLLLTSVALLVLSLAGAARADDPAAIYAKKCAVCHGKDGHPSAMGVKIGAKDLTKLADPKGDPKPIVKSISNGTPGKMAAFKGKLTDEEIDSLAKYILAGMK